MNRFFNADSPVMSFLGRAADLVLLNMLTMLCCIPVVTAGAAFTALYYVTVKMVRGEEGYLAKSYFKSFKENFRQATALWILLLLLGAAAGADFYLISAMDGAPAFVMRAVVSAFVFFLVCSSVYWFALLSKFDNSIKNTVKNSCLISIANFPKTLCILIIYGVFGFLYRLLYIWLLPMIFLLGISVPVYLASYLFSDIFKRLEPGEEEISQSV